MLEIGFNCMFYDDYQINKSGQGWHIYENIKTVTFYNFDGQVLGKCINSK